MSDKKITGLFDKQILIKQIKDNLNGKPAGLDAALVIAGSAFFGVNDKNGAPYVLHLAQVLMSGTQSKRKTTVGLLHDLLEDTNWTKQDLRDVGFDEKIIKAVDYVTKQKDEKYFDMIVRCGTSAAEFTGKDKYLAIDVKIADLSHNMCVDRQTEFLTQGYIKKLDVYIVARNYLVAIKKGHIAPGTSMGAFMDKNSKLHDPALLQEHSSEQRGAGFKTTAAGVTVQERRDLTAQNG